MSDAFTDEDYERVVRERDEALARIDSQRSQIAFYRTACTARFLPEGFGDETIRELINDLMEDRDDARSTIEDLSDEIARGREAIRIYRTETEAAKRERDEARAEVERLREMAHDFEAMRQDRDHHASALKQERREVERLQGDVWALTTTLRNLPVPSPSLVDACTDAYRRGAEAMREAAINYARKIGFYALAADIRCLPIPEAKP